MEHTWRWFGPDDPITLDDIRQTGATGIVTALHEIPNGETWPREAIAERKQMIENAGLTWSVVESVPVHEAIKQASGAWDTYIANYQQTLRNLAACGIDVVCYNFMPVLDWTRTDLAWPLPTGGTALRFDQTAFSAFDLYLLERPGAEADYDATERDAARRYLDTLDNGARQRLIDTVIAGLPGAEEHYTLARFREVIAGYAEIDAERLRTNLGAFLRAVVPVAEEVGIRLAIHPDDPPRPLLGLPRVVSTPDDAQWILDAVPSPANGLTFCTGSYGVSAAIDLVAMGERFAERIYFAHLRATQREADPRSFHEAAHLDGDVDMVGVVKALVDEERRRERDGGPRLPLRPDHGHHLLDDLSRETRPGYPLIGRLKGLAELRGVEAAVRRLG
ncbi:MULTISPECIES: mannonate dehydratase [unclassified Modicisalibacter]|uniref:mannonate dehydratase n=1 Tax=unclassified Modicisalibacter TaxID=2679913 RepID=UPI001CCFAFED|nr:MULTISPECIES: mannonate dehydratase [unclassified Modicisalibacter]MBZ9558171.1 mannonate dehydratase [Modicisalibacter sp. R2A 31.J]MBZ9573160.1 mannonate dehydratase [Modicisalibacter sp. MOD 31.J]